MEQAHHPAVSAGIATGLIESEHTDWIVQKAFSVGSPAHFQEVKALLHLDNSCTAMRCSFSWGPQELGLEEHHMLPAGFSVNIRVSRPATDATTDVQSHFEELSLMQTSEPQTMTGRWKRQGTNLPPTNDECHHFSFNPDAPEFRPGMFQLAGYSEFIQDLAVAWDTVAFSWQDEPASARIITWFVDHRFPFPRCLHGREVTLYDDYAAWEEHIKRRWVDQLDLRYDLEMHLITPTPPRLEPEIAAHVVLIQAPGMDWVSNLVSVDDRMWHPFNAGYPTGLIITTHEHIRFEHVVQACGYDEACIWPIGFLGGPPCETWSRAREHSVKHQGAVRDGPRVVRTVDTPWGMDCLALREIRQILIGNQLMFFAILMMVELYYTGGCGALEHPALPSKQTSASIWRTPLLELLLSLHEFALLEFAQGLLGAATAKPTMILALRLPSLSLQICKGRVVADLPKGASLGLGNDGKFRTMILKEYPLALCSALAAAFGHFMDTISIDAHVQVSQHFQDTCSAMHVQEYGTEIGPDFAGYAPQ